MDRSTDANWLLRVLIILTIGVHIVLLLYLAGIYRFRALRYIEISINSIVKPSARAIPRPRPRIPPPQPRVHLKTLPVAPRPVPKFKPPSVAPIESGLPDTLAEGIRVPDVPQAPDIGDTAWVPGLQADEAVGEYMTVASYLDMVRLKIESCKRYPETVKSWRNEGRVTIRFILATDDTVRNVTVVKGARSQALNAAAVDAVRRAAPFPRPPANLFPRDLALNLTIIFELT